MDKIATFLLFLFFLLNLHCGKFEELNKDPSRPERVATSGLLTSTLRHLRTISFSYLGNLYAQYTSQYGDTRESRYATAGNYNDFEMWYYGPLVNLERIIELNTNEVTKAETSLSGATQNQLAIARILKVYFYLHMTDRWGPLPYSYALEGRNRFRPSYDSQETIYLDCFSELTEAVDMMGSGRKIEGDFLFSGDMNRWRKFANTVRLIAALRMSEVNSELASIEFQQALAAGVITSNEENIFYPFLDDISNANPWYQYYIGPNRQIALSNTLIDLLLDLHDPRLSSFAEPSQSDTTYRGFPYGVAVSELNSDEVSFPNRDYVSGRKSPLPLLTYAQVLFSTCEAAHRGWIDEDPELLYYEAIKASMQQWYAFDPDSFAIYITQPKVKWTRTRAFELIGQQKWIALFMEGYEAWAEWRRLGYPDLQPAPDAANKSGQIPVRLPYPTTERNLNFDSWQFAVDTWLGGDDGFDSKLWWDVD